MTTVFDDDLYWIRMEDRLGRRLGPDFDDYCFPMDDRLGSRLGPNFDDYDFPMDEDWAADSDLTSMTTGTRL